MAWTWDPDKARSNLSKHKVSFELAQHVFEDPFHLTLADPHAGEERWRTLGRPVAAHPGVLFVVHTDGDDEDGRIISARKATAHERRAYEARRP